MKRYINGVPMAFAASIFVGNDEDKKEEMELRPAIKFRNYEEESSCDDGGCDQIQFDVDKECTANIYINGKFKFGPIEGGCTVTIK